MLVTSCARDHWPQPVIDCVARTTDAVDECVAQLPRETLDAFAVREQQWSAEWQPSCSGLNSSFGATAWHVPINLLAPRIDELPGDLYKFAAGFRDWAFSNACESLGLAARRCFAKAKTADDLAVCRGKLDKTEAAAIDERLSLTTDLLVKLREVYRRPSSLECNTVVATRYTDVAWQGKFTRLEPAVRKAMIADSRTRLRDACPKLAKSARACLVVATNETDMLCNLFDPASRGQGSAAPELGGSDFGFPASGVVFKTGIAQCDRYAAAVLAADSCTALPAPKRRWTRSDFTRRVRQIDDAALVETVTSACYHDANTVEKLLDEAGCAKPKTP